MRVVNEIFSALTFVTAQNRCLTFDHPHHHHTHAGYGSIVGVTNEKFGFIRPANVDHSDKSKNVYFDVFAYAYSTGLELYSASFNSVDLREDFQPNEKVIIIIIIARAWSNPAFYLSTSELFRANVSCFGCSLTFRLLCDG